jgi:hypothetical protein
MINFNRAVDFATALQAYAARALKPTDKNNVNTLLSYVKLRETSFDKLFPAMFSIHGLDVKEALNRAIKDEDISQTEADIAIIGFNKAIANISEAYPVLDVNTFNAIQNIIQNFINAFNEGGADYIDNAKADKMKLQLEALKDIFKKPFIVTYFKGDARRVSSVKIAHNSFKNLRDIVNNNLKKFINAELENQKITKSRLNDPTYITTKIFNWSHTQTGDGSILTGKLLAELLSARNTTRTWAKESSSFKLIVEDFVEQTGQEKTSIKMHRGDLTKGDSEVLALVIQSQLFQTVKVGNRRENQQDVGQQEKKWNFLDAGVRKKIFGTSELSQIALSLIKVRSSPNIPEDIGSVIASNIKGELHPSTAKTVPLVDITTPIKKIRKKIVLSKNNTEDLRLDNNQLRTQGGQFYSLTSLHQLINSLLTKTIKENMGTGSRRDILNLRTGRFAESVKVERLTQSREGMITAFYSYMRNPYATFSEGGRQERPKSRDPKLLISKSIREIAETQVKNRLRAVLV